MSNDLAIVSSAEMREAEKKAFQSGASDAEFMDEVARGIAADLLKKPITKVIVVTGKGNNGGDGALVARFLLRKNIDVEIFHLFDRKDSSPLLKTHLSAFIEEGGRTIQVEKAEDLSFPENAYILDGILGSGFSGRVEGVIKEIIEKLNSLDNPVLAIDIPSGLDGNTGECETAIHATFTYFLQLPKWGFFLGKGFEQVGKLMGISFSLEEKFLPTKIDAYMLTKETLKELLPPIKRTRHKYEAGLVVGLCASFEMSGASALASLASLRSGAGYVRYLYPKSLEAKLQVAEEIVKLPFESVQEIVNACKKANAFFIGPGFPIDTKAFELLKSILSTIEMPFVLDGGALFHLANEKMAIPKGAILTPHMGEMSRFISLNSPLEMSDLEKCREFAQKHQITLVLKGAPTYIFHPNAPIYISPFGHPAMATMGSGDVLTGIIAALLAQGLEPLKAAKLGVGIHGIAGEMAAHDLGSYSVIASDLVEYLPDVFLQVEEH